jgi:8-oxo-dGTP diphosphatase
VTVRLGRVLTGPDDGDWPIMHRLTMRVWLAELVTGAPAPLQDHDEVRWVGPAALEGLDWLEPDRPIAAALRTVTARSLT